MKKITLIPLLFTTGISFPQKPSIGIKAGIDLTNATIIYMTYNAESSRDKTSARIGALCGVYLDVPAGKRIILRPEIDLVSKGAKTNDLPGYKLPVKFTFVDIPVNVLYKKSFGEGSLVAGGGPFVGFPVKDYYALYPLVTDYGLNGLVGYELPLGIAFNLNYSYGLANTSGNKEDFKKISNRYLGITIGYTF